MVPQASDTKKVSINSNFIDKDCLIHNIYAGDQTIATLKDAYENLLDLSLKLRRKNKPVHVLTDISRLGKLNLEARLFAVEFIKNMDFDKVAICGNHFMAERMVNYIIIASGRGYKMKYFSNEKDAKLWLSI
jgi:ferredoxin-fold anticodon binding domain-containing protein